MSLTILIAIATAFATITIWTAIMCMAVQDSNTLFAHRARARRLARQAGSERLPRWQRDSALTSIVASFYFYENEHFHAATYGTPGEHDGLARADIYWQALKGLGMSDWDIREVAKGHHLFRR